MSTASKAKQEERQYARRGRKTDGEVDVCPLEAGENNVERFRSFDASRRVREGRTRCGEKGTSGGRDEGRKRTNDDPKRVERKLWPCCEGERRRERLLRSLERRKERRSGKRRELESKFKQLLTVCIHFSKAVVSRRRCFSPLFPHPLSPCSPEAE
jgi:hypothetical protein